MTMSMAVASASKLIPMDGSPDGGGYMQGREFGMSATEKRVDDAIDPKVYTEST
jgi:hypothetical protein